MNATSPGSPHVFIATPCFGGTVTLSYMQSLIACMAEAAGRNLRLTLSTLGSDALITRARNTLLHQFTAGTDATHLLFIDSDIGFSLADILALLEADKPVVGGAYPLKDRYWDADTDRFIARGEPAATASLRYVGDCAALDDAPPRDELVRVSYVGTGFLMIARRTVERLAAAYPQTRYRRVDAKRAGGADGAESADAFALFDCLIDPGTRTYLSEDFSFCRRWTAIGGEIWLHRGVRLSHTGPATFRGDLMARRLNT